MEEEEEDDFFLRLLDFEDFLLLSENKSSLNLRDREAPTSKLQGSGILLVLFFFFLPDDVDEEEDADFLDFLPSF